MQRARDDAVLLALGFLAQIDEGHVGPPDQRNRLGRRSPPSPAARSRPGRSPTRMLAGTATSIIFGLGRFRLFISADVLVDRFHLQARVERASPRRWSRPSRPCSRAPGNTSVSSGSFSSLLNIESYCARGSPFWKSVRPVPRISSVSPVNTRSRHQEAIGIVGVAGRVEHVERNALDGELVALGDPHRDDVGLGLLAHHGDAVGAVAQRAEPGDVVGVEMRVDGLDQLEVELVDRAAGSGRPSPAPDR